jgi:hypothetical protein
VNIFDPLTGNADGSGRQIISCNGVQNVICPDRISPIIKKILPLIPTPNLSGETNNYFASAGFLFDRWTVDSKVNWNVNNKLNIWGRYSVLNFFTVNETVFGEALQGRAINSSNPGTGQGKTHSFSFAGVYTFNSNFIVDANFGLFRQNTDVAQSDIAEKRGLDFLGIPGTNGTRAFEGGFPFFDLETYADYGTVDTFMPYTRRDDQYQIVTNANWLRGPHNIRFGMDVYRQKLNHTQPESSDTSFGARGGFHFGTGTTTLKGGTSGSQFNSFAAFLLGVPDRIGKLTLTEAPYSTRNWQYSFYGRVFIRHALGVFPGSDAWGSRPRAVQREYEHGGHRRGRFSANRPRRGGEQAIVRAACRSGVPDYAHVCGARRLRDYDRSVCAGPPATH